MSNFINKQIIKLPFGSLEFFQDQKRQVINLEKALKNNKVKKPQLREAFINLVNQCNELKINSDNISNNLWTELVHNAEKVGAEKICLLLKELTILSSASQFISFIDFDQLNEFIHEIIEDLREGIECLDRFGFFAIKESEELVNPLENGKILVVEDMEYNRFLLKKIFKQKNCQIIEAVNGEEAISYWQKEDRIDLIIMDMNMPVMDGFTATKSIRQQEREESLKRTPILALTALAMRGDRELCLNAGCDEYLPKPVQGHSLLQISERLITGGVAETDKQNNHKPGTINIKRALIKLDNQIYNHVISLILQELEIDFEQYVDIAKKLEQITRERYDIIILEAEHDMDLAFHIKNTNPRQNIILINTKKNGNSIWGQKKQNSIIYPFQSEQVRSVLQYYSDKLGQAKKKAEELAYADSLAEIKGQVSIEEAVQKSNKQLAVWQKAFRKIGGDLVLSHQFNLHGKFGFILGDVAGHDIKSGYTASWFAGLVKGIWEKNSDPLALLTYLNNFFDHDSEEEDKRFVCALVLLWDPLRSKLHYANAGIPGGILVKKKTGKAEVIHWKGIPIGMFPNVNMYDHDVIDFRTGDRLYMATDGVLEAIPSEVISNISESKRKQLPQQALESIVDFVTRSIKVTDDLTIALFEAQPLKKLQKGLRMTIKSTLKEIDQTIMKIEKHITKYAPDQYDWPMVSIAIREALLNAVTHGNRNKAELLVDLDVEIVNGFVQVNISDCGSGFDLSGEKKRLEEEGELRIHGRGIEMMENICFSLKFVGGGVNLKFAPKNSRS